MAKEIKSTCKLSITPVSGGGSIEGNASTTEDLAGSGGGFTVTVGTTAAAITLPAGLTTPKALFVQNVDPTNFVEIDNVITLDNWKQTLLPGQAVLLRPGSGTLFGKADSAPIKAWIVAG